MPLKSLHHQLLQVLDTVSALLKLLLFNNIGLLCDAVSNFLVTAFPLSDDASLLLKYVFASEVDPSLKGLTQDPLVAADEL